MLQEQGRLDIQDSVVVHLEGYPHAGVTIHHLLSHSSGIPNYVAFPEFMELARAAPELPQLLATFLDRPLVFSKGECFLYSNSNYALLAHLIEEISGQDYKTFYHDHLFGPLGLDSTGFVDQATPAQLAIGYVDLPMNQRASIRDMSVFAGAGDAYGTVHDLQRWEAALRAGELLSEASRQAMFFRAVVADLQFMAAEGTGYYGYAVVTLERLGRELQGHAGRVFGFRAAMFRYVDDGGDVIVIVLANSQEVDHLKISKELASIVLGR